MRMNSVYWMLYVALYLDNNYCLISYFYYVKYAKPEDRTAFHHVDINLSDLIESGQDKNQIQDVVFLDDKISDECTEILPGLHHHLKEWWEHVKQQGLQTESFVHQIKNIMYTAANTQHFDIQWTDVLCKRRTVWITLSHLSHDAHDSTQWIQQMMLSWYVDIQNDHNILEVIESGTWSRVAAAHRDLIHAEKSPSDLANQYGTILYKFPATVLLTELGPISDALIECQWWNVPSIIRLRNLLLESDFQKIADYITIWHIKAVEDIVTSFYENVESNERSAFRNQSFFYCREQGISSASLQKDDLPSDDIQAAIKNTEQDPGDHY